MTTFRYRAYDSSGKSVAGEIEADGYKAAVEGIKNNGLYPADVDASEAEGRLWSRLKPVTSETLAVTTRQFSTLLGSGSTMTEALTVLAENTTSKRLGNTLVKLKEEVIGGSTLSTAMGAHPGIFSPFYCGLVSSGEASGSMDSVLGELADYLESRAQTVRELKTALAYPLLMLVVGITVLAFLFIFVIPKITRIFTDTGTDLPLITVLLIWCTEMVVSYWPLIIAVGVVTVTVWLRYRTHPRVTKTLDRLLLKSPWAGPLATCFYVSTMTRTLGSLLSGGVPLLGALEITKGVVNNTEYKLVLDSAIEECAEGASLAESLKREGRVPSMVLHMISVGEKSGSLDSMLVKTAESYEEQFSNGLKRAIALIEPLMLLAMGLIVGLIVLAILLPIFELNQIVR
jgi:general secretion pathway protein F